MILRKLGLQGSLLTSEEITINTPLVHFTLEGGGGGVGLVLTFPCSIK